MGNLPLAHRLSRFQSGERLFPPIIVSIQPLQVVAQSSPFRLWQFDSRTNFNLVFFAMIATFRIGEVEVLECQTG